MAWLCEYLALVMATMVDAGLIEINSRTLKRIEGNDEATMNPLRGSAIPN